MPSAEVDSSLRQVADVMVAAGVAKSKGEAKRLIEGGGVALDGDKVENAFAEIGEERAAKGEFILHKGKKVHVKILLKK